MIIYYFCSENKYGVEVYNGVKATVDALKDSTPFDDAVNIVLRSGDLCVSDIPSKDSLTNELSNIVANAEAAGMDTFFIPNDNFIDKSSMRAIIMEVIPNATDSLMEAIMFSMTPVAFFGELSEEELRREILTALKACCVVEEVEEV